MISPATPIAALPRAKRISSALGRLGIKTVRDLLFHFPSRYENFSDIRPIAAAAAGDIVTIRGVIEKLSSGRTARKHMALVEARVRDEAGDALQAVWFNQPFLARTFKTGDRVTLSGKIALGKRGLYLSNPAYEKAGRSDAEGDAAPGVHTGRLVPVYPETAGVTSRWLRFLIATLLPLREKIPDALPAATRARRNLPALPDALAAIHFPDTLEAAAAAKRRFVFGELLLFHLRALRERAKLRRERAPEIALNLPLIKEFVAALPFPLTDAQRRSLWEIANDMARSSPMNRLLEGDVGSGKTVVAAAAALSAARAGWRTAFMAPTEILARQHHETLARILAPFGVAVGIMTAGKKRAERDAAVVVGTHALIQKHAHFENLGLVVVDEQHRFGVAERAALLKKGATDFLPHFLSMSATPIPRTLALTIYGDLDLSILDELPKSRQKIITKIAAGAAEREETYQFIREEAGRGRQAFIICPRIEIEGASPGAREGQQRMLAADTKAVKEEYERLSKKIFPDLRVGMLHGRMKAKEKDEVMRRFRERAIDVLVATSVVEVGVDIPNATSMVIEGAERFGLAQLHQFRGRVGRGAEQAYCFLFPTDDGPSSARLRAVASASSGFELAEIDLKLRGPGALFGTRQSGVPDAVLEGITDAALVREVQQEAAALVRESPDLSRFPELLGVLESMERSVHLE